MSEQPMGVKDPFLRELLPTDEAYPVAITLRFRTPEERSFWLGGLLDGWGENGSGMVWWEGECDLAATFYVDPWHVREDEDE